ncbi:MAG: hypothetical protein K8T10_19280, partial [Candidatus Eremiobacteraeota bacterium]|nr:hypothetical protein [Candidatus Eremiobacteraeota bacterium]
EGCLFHAKIPTLTKNMCTLFDCKKTNRTKLITKNMIRRMSKKVKNFLNRLYEAPASFGSAGFSPPTNFFPISLLLSDPTMPIDTNVRARDGMKTLMWNQEKMYINKPATNIRIIKENIYFSLIICL